MMSEVGHKQALQACPTLVRFGQKATFE